MTFTMDPARVRELAGQVRSSATGMTTCAPLRGPEQTDRLWPNSEAALAFDQATSAMDSVIAYHSRRLHEFSDLAEQAVRDFEHTDHGFGHNLHQAGPK